MWNLYVYSIALLNFFVIVWSSNDHCVMANNSYSICPILDVTEPLHQTPANAVISPEDKVVGCWMHKVSSRVLVDIFERITKCIQQPLMNCERGHCQHNVHDAGHCRNVTNPKAFNNKEYLRFVAVRDPVLRFYSGYLNKMAAHAREHIRGVVQNYGGVKQSYEQYLNNTGKPNTALTFLEALYLEHGKLSTNGALVNAHFHPQKLLCRLDEIKYDLYIDANKDIIPSMCFIDIIKPERNSHIYDFAVKASKGLARLSSPLRHGTNSKELICFDADREKIFLRVKQLYQRDYEILNILGLAMIESISSYCADK